LVIIRYNMNTNTFQVVNYIGHDTDPYWLTNYCAVEILIKIFWETITIKSTYICTKLRMIKIIIKNKKVKVDKMGKKIQK
jgi:hypothetical protein